MLALTGAGISSNSGIPTYRDQDGNWQRSDPIQHKDFLSDPWSRQKYWCRSLIGWPQVQLAKPNRAHFALAALEEAGYINLIVTQNVDRLHQHAGSLNTIDLHGRLDRVVCLGCGDMEPRSGLQQRLEALNPGRREQIAEVLPDGDAEAPPHLVEGLKVPECKSCGGTLMPDVVFFGGNVPRLRVNRVSRALERANGLLVVGSSLQVFSGYRFCRQAFEWGKPIAAINRGATRGDPMISIKINRDCSGTLDKLLQELGLEAIL